MSRLSKGGFKSDFVRTAILPDWWESALTQQADLLPDIEVRVARFLGVPLATVRDPSAALTPAPGAQARLRKVRDMDADRLRPAIHTALQVGCAVVRSLKSGVPPRAELPVDALAWRHELCAEGRSVSLGVVLKDLWERGIPVVPLEVLPSPKFQGAAFIAEGRPVVAVGHRYDQPGRVAFLVAHEAGHVSAGDCAPGAPVVDEEEEQLDESPMEKLADRYAIRVLFGLDEAPRIDATNPRQLAMRAHELERTTGLDAGHILFAWAARTRDYAMATMAVKALYRGTGARDLMRDLFDRHVDLDAASESDRALLRCVYGDPERDAAPP